MSGVHITVCMGMLDSASPQYTGVSVVEFKTQPTEF